MDSNIEVEIGIVDYRNIIRVIKDSYGYDFSDYALTSLKRRFEQSLVAHNIKDVDMFISQLKEDKLFFNKFLQEIIVESTEMFRDPSLWRYLRDELLPFLMRDGFKPRIWFPSCVSGDELFTLAILLKENGWENKFEILATCINDDIIGQVQKGILKTSKVEISIDNYQRFQGKSSLRDYLMVKGSTVSKDTSLIKNVNFIKQNINFDNSPQDIKLIMFRNQMIYYNQNMQDRVLKTMHESIQVGGFMVIGVREQLGLLNNVLFKTVNESENVYKKI